MAKSDGVGVDSMNMIIPNNLYHPHLLVSRENAVIFCLASLKYLILIVENPSLQFNVCHFDLICYMNCSQSFIYLLFIMLPSVVLLDPLFLSLIDKEVCSKRKFNWNLKSALVWENFCLILFIIFIFNIVLYLVIKNLACFYFYF